MSYSDLHDGRLPRVEKEPPRNMAGVVVPILYQEGLGKGLNIRCPSNETPAAPLHSLEELDNAYNNQGGAFTNLANQLSGGYAYALGFQDASGQLHGLRVDKVLMDNDLIPVMADRPSFNQTEGVFADTTPQQAAITTPRVKTFSIWAVKCASLPIRALALISTISTSTSKTASQPDYIASTPSSAPANSSPARSRRSRGVMREAKIPVFRAAQVGPCLPQGSTCARWAE